MEKKSAMLGYGRYKDDPDHVGCPRARSDMTPCIARDGRLALDEDGMCVGCGIKAWDALVAIKRAQKLSPPSASQWHDHFADQLQKIVRRITEPTRAMTDHPLESTPANHAVEPNPGPLVVRTGAPSARTISLHNAQVERVRASLNSGSYKDVYRNRDPRPGPIQPPVVDRSSWTRTA